MSAKREKSDPFWSSGATQIIYIVLTALGNKRADPKFNNLVNLRWLINQLSDLKKKWVLDYMVKNLNDIMFAEFIAFINGDDRVVDSFLSMARAALDLWSDPDVQRLTDSDNIDIENLRQERTIIYLTPIFTLRKSVLGVLTVSSLWDGRGEVPSLRLTGKWLERLGFSQGTKFKLEGKMGRITLVLLESEEGD